MLQISELLCQDGGEVEEFLNKLVIVQANHSKIDLGEMFENVKLIKTQKERAVVLQKMPKHVREIFKQLDEIRSGRLEKEDPVAVDFLLFMNNLCDNIKNLAARLCLLDKKSQKTLIGKIQTELEVSYDDNLYLKLVYLNLKLCNNCYLTPQKSMSKKVQEKSVALLLRWLSNCGYIQLEDDEAAGPIPALWSSILELAVAKKIPAKKEYLAARNIGDEAAVKDKVRQWVKERQQAAPAKKPEESKEEEPKEIVVRREDVDNYFVRLLQYREEA